MDVIFVLVPVSLVLILLALRVFSWAIEDGQFEDLDREARRILIEDDLPPEQRSARREPGRDGAREERP